MTWEEYALGDICHIQIGRTPSRANPKFWDGQHPWLSIADMGRSRDISETKEKITDLGAKTFGDRLVQPGTLLFSFKLSIGKVGIAKIPLYTNEAIAALPIKNREKVCEEYLFYTLQNLDLQSDTDRAVMGQTLNKKKLTQIKISLPPIAQQKRIAAILDKADAVRRKRREAIRLTEELLRSTFLEMFGDPITNPKRWERKKIYQVANVVTGNTPPRSNLDNYGDYIEWIKSDNIADGNHFLTQASECLSDVGMKIARLAPEGSILVTCIAGSPQSIGKAALVDRLVSFNQQINAIIPKNVEDQYFLYSSLFVAPKLVRSISTQSMKGLVSKSKFENIDLIYPPAKERAVFCKFFESMVRAQNIHKESLNQSEAFFNSLLQRAFTGSL